MLGAQLHDKTLYIDGVMVILLKFSLQCVNGLGCLCGGRRERLKVDQEICKEVPVGRIVTRLKVVGGGDRVGVGVTMVGS